MLSPLDLTGSTDGWVGAMLTGEGAYPKDWIFNRDTIHIYKVFIVAWVTYIYVLLRSERSWHDKKNFMIINICNKTRIEWGLSTIKSKFV